MNPYFSKREKENFVRLKLLFGLLDLIIEDYDKSNKLDKDFMANLRRTRTYTQKTLNRRIGFLDSSAKDDLDVTVSRMELLFVPRREVVKYYQEIEKLNSIVRLEQEDFSDWFELMIEYACKTCARSDFKNCRARQILMKIGMYPYNPAAVNQCQYSYVETDEQQGIGVIGDTLLKAKKKKGGTR
ncbi:hypothetical protein SRRS_06930 [Sporomusa rhizae]|uniref:DUF5651 domain-containing protein n=1 Tax=Sporomusa rhizae TaxID=357999 RepID=UPI00352B66D6